MYFFKEAVPLVLESSVQATLTGAQGRVRGVCARAAMQVERRAAGFAVGPDGCEGAGGLLGPGCVAAGFPRCGLKGIQGDRNKENKSKVVPTPR